jgi:hypothetical protein
LNEDACTEKNEHINMDWKLYTKIIETMKLKRARWYSEEKKGFLNINQKF